MSIRNIFYLIIFLICLILVVYLVSPTLNLFNQHLFDFHDDSQLSRVHEFVLNLKNGQIPPRIAPDYSYKLGFPIFNYYAPFSYWVAGSMAYLGLSEIFALKISFFLTVILAFIAMYFFLRNFFKFFPSLLGAAFYVTSTYFAVEIIIRGNLAECWYLALLPASLHFLTKNAKSKSKLIFVATAIILSFLITSHNVFSLISLFLFTIYLLFLPNKFKNCYSIFLALLIAGYFLLPSITELKLTQAVAQATLTRYQDHFLCAWQLWKSNGWHYGGSVPGCDGDQMSFQLGKIQTTIAIFGFILLAWQTIIKRQIKKNNIPIFVSILTLFSLFLTLYQSQFIWDRLAFIMAVFQFPWRFLVFGMFGIAFLSAYFFNHIKISFKTVIIITIILVSFLSGKKYFGKPLYDPKTYNNLYNSQQFRETTIVYKVREYLSKEADPNYWWSLNPGVPEYRPITFNYKLPIESQSKFTVLRNNYFDKQIKIEEDSIVKINIHYFPFWKIYINGKQFVPNKFDKLGRPVIKLSKTSTISIIYEQTTIEKLGNMITLLGFLLLITSTIFDFPQLIKRHFSYVKPRKLFS